MLTLCRRVLWQSVLMISVAVCVCVRLDHCHMFGNTSPLCNGPSCHLSVFTVITKEIRFGRALGIWKWPRLCLRHALKIYFFQEEIIQFCLWGTIIRTLSHCLCISICVSTSWNSFFSQKTLILRGCCMWVSKIMLRACSIFVLLVSEGLKQLWFWFNPNCQFTSH